MPKPEGIPMNEFMSRIRTPPEKPEEHFKRFAEAMQRSKFPLKLRMRDAAVILASLRACEPHVGGEERIAIRRAAKRVQKYAMHYQRKFQRKLMKDL